MSALDPEIERRLEEDRRKIRALQEERAREAAAKEAAERAERQRRAQEALEMLQSEAEKQAASDAEAAIAQAAEAAAARAAAHPAEPEAPPRPPLPADYTVQPGDTLSAIALKFYGNAALWPEIFKANKRVIGKDPGKIFVGQKLHIPKLD